MNRHDAGAPDVAAGSTPPLVWRVTAGIMQAAIALLLIGGAWLGMDLEEEASRGSGGLGMMVFMVFAFVAAWAGATVLTMRARRPIARWIGGTLIGMFVVGGLDGLGGASDAPATLGAWMAYELLMLAWLYAFACSDGVSRYVGRG